MQDLTGKVTGSPFPPSQWNQLPKEIQNVITSTGLSLSGGDLEQFVKSLMQYVNSGTFGIDSGVADAYVLNTVGTFSNPHSFKDGFTVRFIATNTNTGPSTINVFGLGVKNIVAENGSSLAAGEISSTNINFVYYKASTDNWRLASPGLSTATESVKGGLPIATQTEVDEGVIDTKFVTPLKLENAGGAASQNQYAVKTTDTPRVNDAVRSGDPDLDNVLVLTANSKYVLDSLFTFDQASTGGGGFSLEFQLPAGSTMKGSVRYRDSSGNEKSLDVSGSTSLVFDIAPADIDGDVIQFNIFAGLSIGGTGANLRVLWAQETSSGNSTILQEETEIKLQKIG